MSESPSGRCAAGRADCCPRSAVPAMTAETAFWFSIALVVYAYAGYPLALMALTYFTDRPVRKCLIQPRVSFVIAAHNEQQRIAEKINNTLRQDYPAESIEIIVASDCSTDRTDEIVRS